MFILFLFLMCLPKELLVLLKMTAIALPVSGEGWHALSQAFSSVWHGCHCD
jgi:hypothetical protein